MTGVILEPLKWTKYDYIDHLLPHSCNRDPESTAIRRCMDIVQPYFSFFSPTTTNMDFSLKIKESLKLSTQIHSKIFFWDLLFSPHFLLKIYWREFWSRSLCDSRPGTVKKKLILNPLFIVNRKSWEFKLADLNSLTFFRPRSILCFLQTAIFRCYFGDLKWGFAWLPFGDVTKHWSRQERSVADWRELAFVGFSQSRLVVLRVKLCVKVVRGRRGEPVQLSKMALQLSMVAC